MNLRSELQIQRLQATLDEARLRELTAAVDEQRRLLEEIRRRLDAPGPGREDPAG